MKKCLSRHRLLASFFIIISVSLGFGSCTSNEALPSSTPPNPTSTATKPPLPTNTTETISSTVTPAACPPIDATIRADIRRLEDQVVRLRGLQPTSAVSRDLLSPAQLRERVEQDFLADYTAEEARRDSLLLSLLGLIEPELDLPSLYVDLLSEQVAGYYDSQEDEMIIVCGAGFGGLETFTYVHEYVHALQDQAYDLEAGLNFNEEECDLDGERCFALRALIEGDASLLQEQWLRTYADAEILESLMASLGELESPVLSSAPDYIQAELTFPYLAGLSFVHTLYLEGDWAAVDAAYQNPPITSEQILHPERYPRDVPIKLRPPTDIENLEVGWELTAQDVLGEWATEQVLLSYLPEEAAQKGAGGWGGDLIFLLEIPGGDEAAVVLISQWDTMRDAYEFASALMNYGMERFGEPAYQDLSEATWVFDGGTSHFLRQSNQTRWIIAPDGETLSSLQSTFRLPLSPVP